MEKIPVITIVEKAARFATEAHAGQFRDGGQVPYMVHPGDVAEILWQVTDDENLIAAGLLHDTIEDTDVTYEQLRSEFGQDIADLVHEVTKEGGKDADGYYFPRLHSRRGIMLKFADRLSNLSGMQGWDDKKQQHYLNKSYFWKSEL